MPQTVIDAILTVRKEKRDWYKSEKNTIRWAVIALSTARTELIRKRNILDEYIRS